MLKRLIVMTFIFEAKAVAECFRVGSEKYEILINFMANLV